MDPTECSRICAHFPPNMIKTSFYGFKAFKGFERFLEKNTVNFQFGSMHDLGCELNEDLLANHCGVLNFKVFYGGYSIPTCDVHGRIITMKFYLVGVSFISVI